MKRREQTHTFGMKDGRQRRTRLPAMFIALAALMLLLAACDEAADSPTDGAGTETTPTATVAEEPTATAEPTAEQATPTTVPATPSPVAEATATPDSTEEELTLSVYFLRDEKIGTAHRTVPYTLQTGAASMNELLQGPTDFEQEAGLTTAIPEGTELLDLTIEDGIATVDLSSEFESGGGSLSMTARLAQVVYTLTQFDTVDAVNFEIEGEPVNAFGGEGIILDEPADRAQFEDVTPIIFVESPAPGDVVQSPVHVWGTANTFEATYHVEIVDNSGQTIHESHYMATSGTGTRGTFDETIEFDLVQPGMGSIIFFELSARDGSRVNVVEIPVEFVE